MVVVFLIVGIAAVLALASLLDRGVFPEPDPSPAYYPAVGHVFNSKSEGFTQRVLQRDENRIWIETTLHPHAPGPPPHLHRTFTERFMVVAGSVSVFIGDEVKVLRAGQEVVIPPGIAHKPFNPTDEEAIIRGPLTPEYSLPLKFGVFLTQAYGFFDESADNGKPPRALLQMARFSQHYDTWLGSPPILVQRGLYLLLGPPARLMGYRGYYLRFAPTPAALPVSK